MSGETGSLALLCTTLDWGGSEGNVVELARGYARRGLKPFVIVDSPPLHRLAALQEANIPVQVLYAEQHWTPGRYRATLSAVLREAKAKVLHAHVWERQPEIFAAAEDAGVPVAVTVHDTVSAAWRFRVGIVGRPLRYRRTRQAFRDRNPVVINISALSDLNFRRVYPGVSHTRLVYCGAYLPPAPVDAAVGGTAPHVLWVGSLIPRKRPLEALEMWRHVQARFPQARLTLVGSGPLLEQAREKALALPSVTVAGNVSDMSSLLDSAQIMLHTATHEGIPKNIIYANTFGIPTVSTRAGAISEAVFDGETGFLSEVNDLAGLTESLCALIGDGAARGALGLAARELGKRHFDLEHHIDETLRVYSDLCGVHLPYIAGCAGERPATLT